MLLRSCSTIEELVLWIVHLSSAKELKPSVPVQVNVRLKHSASLQCMPQAERPPTSTGTQS